MRLKYPHARLAVANQLSLGRSCKEAMAAAAHECQLKTSPCKQHSEGENSSSTRRCHALEVAENIFANQIPEQADNFLQKLIDKLKVCHEGMTLLHDAKGLTTCPMFCNTGKCLKIAPCVLDLILQALDENALSDQSE